MGISTGDLDVCVQKLDVEEVERLAEIIAVVLISGQVADIQEVRRTNIVRRQPGGNTRYLSGSE
jgi:hypothetical protein